MDESIIRQNENRLKRYKRARTSELLNVADNLVTIPSSICPPGETVPVVTTESGDGDLIRTILLKFYENLDKLCKEDKHHG